MQELERSILEHDSSLDADAVAVTRGTSVGVCPFKGLASFDRPDAEYFCGRERLVSDLLARLVETPLVGILGSSGIGKSSLLHAGVLPALSEGSLPAAAIGDRCCYDRAPILVPSWGLPSPAIDSITHSGSFDPVSGW